MKRKTPITLLLTALMLVGACGDDIEGPVDPTELTFAPALNVNLAEMTKTASGLYIKDEVVGSGAEAIVGSTVTVDYTGWLHSGRQFDTSVGRSPFTITNLGRANLIAGWNEGLVGMRAGGRRLLVIPPHLAYGSRGSGGAIPPHATLVFRVDLRSVGQ